MDSQDKTASQLRRFINGYAKVMASPLTTVALIAIIFVGVLNLSTQTTNSTFDTRSSANQSASQFTIQPSEKTVARGDEFQLRLFTTTDQLSVQSIDLNLNLENTNLKVSRIYPYPTIFHTASPANTPLQNIFTTLTAKPNTTLEGEQQIATLYLIAEKPGTTTVSFNGPQTITTTDNNQVKLPAPQSATITVVSPR